MLLSPSSGRTAATATLHSAPPPHPPTVAGVVDVATSSQQPLSPTAATAPAAVPLPLTSPDTLSTVGPTVSPALSATPVHTTPSAQPVSPDKLSISPASSSVSSDSSSSSASSNLSAPSSDDVLSAASASSSSANSSSDTSNVSTLSTTSTGTTAYTDTAAADRQRAHVAELAYQALLSNIRALSEHVAAVQLSNTVPDIVKVGLEETLEKAKRGWKKIKAERKKRRKKKKRAQRERAIKQLEAEQLLDQQASAVAAVVPMAVVDSSQPATVVSGAVVGGGVAGVVVGSNILQVLSSGSAEREVGRKRRQLSDSSAADTTADDEAEDGEDDEDDEVEGEEVVSPPLAFAAVPRVAVMSLASPATGLPAINTVAASLTPTVAATLSTHPPATPTAYQSSDGVSDAQAPVVMSCSKFPITVLNVPVQRQYTMTRKDSKRMKRADKEALVNVTVRIMGTPDRLHIYFVAKDVCQLICLRKGSVAKAIHDFTAGEKARMPVLCQRSSGSGCTQVLTVLTMAGVQRLMTSSRQPIARSVLQWLSERVSEIQAGQMPSTAFDPNTPADSSHTQSTATTSAAAAAGQQLSTTTADLTTLLFPPQSQLPSAPSTVSLYQQYGLSDMSVDVPQSPQIGFTMSNFPSYGALSAQQSTGHSLATVGSFANHALFNPTSGGMSLPSFSPVLSFGSSTSSYHPLPPQKSTTLHSQSPLLPVGYPSILSQLIASSPSLSTSASPAFSTPHQTQSNSGGHSLFLSGTGGVNLFSGLTAAGGGSHQSTPQHPPGPAQPPTNAQSHFNHLLAVHQHQQQQQRLADQHAAAHLHSPTLSLSHPAPRPLAASSPHRPPATSHHFLSATSSPATHSPYNINTTPQSHRGQLP